ncbi:MAG: hypothetical protein Q7K44_03345 [Candidatus Liptonbacteria bacterium]|nr:hypothetical protein [Candidatus Liptonbacteria bacterium]
MNFDDKNFTLLLNVDKNQLDFSGLRKIAGQNGFDEKNELHITIIGFKNGAEIKKILQTLSREDQEDIIYQIKSLTNNMDWSFTLKPERYHISKEYAFRGPQGAFKEKRESYIQMANMPCIKNFYDILNKILGTNLETPPPHITLFTSGDNREKAKMGIGINSEAELAQLNPKPI